MNSTTTTTKKSSLVTRAYALAKPKGVPRAHLVRATIPALRAYLEARNNRRVNYTRYPETFAYGGRTIASANPGCPAGFRRNRNHGLVCKPRMASFLKAAVIAHRVISYKDVPVIADTLSTRDRETLEAHDQKIQNALEAEMKADVANHTGSAQTTLMGVLYEMALDAFKTSVLTVLRSSTGGVYNAIVSLAQMVGTVLKYTWTGTMALASTMWANRGNLLALGRFLYENAQVTSALYRFAKHLSHWVCGALGQLNDTPKINAVNRWTGGWIGKNRLVSMVQWYDRGVKTAEREMPAWDKFASWLPIGGLCTTMVTTLKAQAALGGTMVGGPAIGTAIGYASRYVTSEAICAYAQSVLMRALHAMMIRSKIRSVAELGKLFDCTQHRVRNDVGAITGMVVELGSLQALGTFLANTFGGGGGEGTTTTHTKNNTKQNTNIITNSSKPKPKPKNTKPKSTTKKKTTTPSKKTTATTRRTKTIKRSS